MQKSPKTTPINMQILTPSGFQSFHGIEEWYHQEYITFDFDDNTSLSCANKHIFIINDKEVYADEIITGQFISPKKKVVKIHKKNDGMYFYDPINVQNGEVYCHDESFISHNSFVATGDTLIGTESLLKMNYHEPMETNNNFKMYEPVHKDHQYILTVDVSQGTGNDYSAFNIIDISEHPYKQVATYYDNHISPILYGSVIYRYAKQYNYALVIVENNDHGVLVCHDLHYNLEYENLYLSSSLKAEGIGIKTTQKTKKIGCSLLKDLIETDNLEIIDKNTIEEFMTFCVKGTSFEATQGNHDDLVMSLVLFGYFTTLPDFQEYQDINMKNMLFSNQIEKIEDELSIMLSDNEPSDRFMIDNQSQIWEVVDL